MSRLRQSVHGSAHLHRSPSCIGPPAARRSAPRRRSRHTCAISRRELRPRSVTALVPPENRGRRESRMPDAPAASYAKVKSIRVSHHRFTGSIRPSPRNGFNGFLRALPGDRALLSPSPRNAKHCRELTPASGRQDHTTSPSAFCAVFWCKNVHRIPPNVRDDGQRPSFGRDARSHRCDLPDRLSEIFLRAGLDTPATDLPVGQISKRRGSPFPPPHA